MSRFLVSPPLDRSRTAATSLITTLLLVWVSTHAFTSTCVAEPAGRSVDTAVADLNGSITSILPDDTIFWLSVPDWEATVDGLANLPMLRLFASEEMKRFREQTEERSTSFLIDAYGVDYHTIDENISGEFIIAGLTTAQGEMSITCFVQTPNEAAAGAFVDATATLLKQRGAVEESPGTPGTVQLALTIMDEQLVLGTLGSCAVLCGDVGVAANLVKRWQQHSSHVSNEAGDISPGGNRRLVEQNEFAETISAFRESPPSLLRWYFDPIAYAVASENASQSDSDQPSDPATNEEPFSNIPFPMRHGFPGLQAIAGRAWINPTNGDLESRTLVYAPTRKDAMEMFQFEPGSLEIPKWLSDEANVATLVRWNLGQMISNAEAVYDDVTDAPGAFEGTMEDLKNELNVDLLGGLFPVIGPELVIYSVNDTARNNESTVVSIEIQDPAKNEKSVASMMYNLFVGDPEARRIRLPGKRYEMWQIKLIVDEDTTPFSKAGLTVADGRLWFCTHASTLQKMLLRRQTSPLAETDVYRIFDQVVSRERAPESFGVSIARMDRDAKKTYEVLRSSGIQGLENVESIYATLLRSIFLRQPAEDVAEDVRNAGSRIADEIDFSVLPSYDFARQFLKNLAVISRNTETGWEIFAVVFDEESASP
ncbi:MAG: hypothetical protein ACF8CQ_22725 [Rhodopirellula sp. JB044]|uniref:hypothetical protein n=1 Tax=Rhodopirellula sp. JB044 TaxID=3342844 RepID=UPI00370A97EA